MEVLTRYEPVLRDGAYSQWSNAQDFVKSIKARRPGVGLTAAIAYMLLVVSNMSRVEKLFGVEESMNGFMLLLLFFLFFGVPIGLFAMKAHRYTEMYAHQLRNAQFGLQSSMKHFMSLRAPEFDSTKGSWRLHQSVPGYAVWTAHGRSSRSVVFVGHRGFELRAAAEPGGHLVPEELQGVWRIADSSADAWQFVTYRDQ